jgi:two-component system CheB/CheR fusion protein
VVGIGASAGGLSALQEFFNAMPPDTGLAFVVITHLHPEYESHMAELLQHQTEMKVRQVNARVTVEPNHVYVIPPNRRILMADHKLDVQEFDEPRGSRMPIDHFFRSLALVHHSIVGIILSGSGTDGSVGIKAIKESGGLLLVQNPEEAEYDGMPRAAISTGIVDAVLGIRELTEMLSRYAQHPAPLSQNPEDLTPPQQETMQRILAHVHARTGHDFSQYKRATILRRVQRRMQLSGHDSLESYLGYMRHNVNEANAMFNDILIGVTNFFRDPIAWDAIKRKVLPELFENKPVGEAIRIWSIGCSTGEEAYTLGMILLEHAAELDRKYQIQVFASDLDDHALARAREGIYPSAIEADVSPERLERFFSPRKNHYQVRPELRDIVLFTSHSILRDPPFSKLDLISCRNLLIYLQREMHENILDIFHYSLNPGGYLFLGGSESADSTKELFQNVDKANRLYKAKPWAGEHPHIPALPLKALSTHRSDIYIPARPMHRRFISGMPPLEEQHLKSLEAFGPPSIWVDEDYVILNLSESAGRFLLQPGGPITNDVIKLVRPELQIDLRSALFQAFDKGQAVVCQPVLVQFNGHARRVVIAVRPEKRSNEADRAHEKKALVVFLEDETELTEEVPEKKQSRDRSQTDAQVLQLEGEVQHLRERLQTLTEEFNSSSEEMKASNEELQSINEEYRSTTEELETSKEELQSVNEELQTVNSELRSKVEEISHAHSDLENLMDATQIATIFLDRELKIKRYSPSMEQLFNIRASDRGRPLSDLTHKLNYDKLENDARDVLQNLGIIERETTTTDGISFLIRLRPYRTIENRIDGVVISFVDITDSKAAESVRQSYESFYTLFHANPIPSMLTTLETNTIMNVNQAFLRLQQQQQQQLKREDVIGHKAEEFSLNPALIAAASQGSDLRNSEQTLVFPSGEKKTMLISTQRIFIEHKDAVLSTFTDITERAQAEEQVRALHNERVAAEAAERQRIAQLLHDDLQQRIFAIKMHLERLEDGVERNDMPSAKEDFAKLEAWLAEAIDLTRRLSSDLNPLAMPGSTLAESITWLASEMKEQYGLETRLELTGLLPMLDTNLMTTLLQVLRELLFNVVKHAGTLQAAMTLESPESQPLKITVADKGKGFQTKTGKAGDRVSGGLANVRQQLKLIGCDFEIESTPHKGTRAIITVPTRSLETET